MRFIILILAALMCVPALAADEMVYSDGNLTVRLTLAPCEVSVVAAALAGAGGQTPPRAAWVKTGAQELRGCWSVLGDKVLIGDESGDSGYILIAAFRPASGI